jgi:hypothetical protein
MWLYKPDSVLCKQVLPKLNITVIIHLQFKLLRIFSNLPAPCNNELENATQIKALTWFCSWQGLQCASYYYNAGKLLPHLFTLTKLKVWRYIFCCTFPIKYLMILYAGHYPVPCFLGVRTFLKAFLQKPCYHPRHTGKSIL